MKKVTLKKVALTGLLALGCAMPAQAYEALSGPTGVIKYDKEKAYDGYTLFSPNLSKTSYLMDNEGQIVHTWKTDMTPGRYAILLENGNLLRGGQYRTDKGAILRPANLAATWNVMQELDWDGNVVWEYELSSEDNVAHHGFYRMPNGNTLMLGFEGVTKDEAKKLGRKEIFEGSVKVGKETTDKYWLDFIREVSPDKKVVWEWHLKDHLGKGADKVDFNLVHPAGMGKAYSTYDWSHANTVNYLPKTDQVLINFRNLSEFLLIDHKTGDIEYRFGNARNYDSKVEAPSWLDNGDQDVFGPHSAHQIDNGNFLIFDNGSERAEVQYSRAVEIDPKTKDVVWEYHSVSHSGFDSQRQGSVQRLPNGNTFICSANYGHLFEVTPKKEVVWEFVNPIFKANDVKIFTTDEEDGWAVAHGAMWNMIHRAYKYGKDYPGLAGKDLSQKGYIAGDDAPVFYKVWKRGLK